MRDFARRRRRLLHALAAACPALLVALVAARAASADALSPESGGSPQADQIDLLYKIVFAAALAVLGGVIGTLVYCLVRFRAKHGVVAPQVHGNTRLEITWTLAATLLVVGLAVLTFSMLPSIEDPPEAEGAATGRPGLAALRIEVTGQQYLWRYRYPGGVLSYEEMVVPTATTVWLDVTADDVVHSWWIPKLGGKFDAVPGYVNRTWFRIAQAGIYRGQCAELCGQNHADMLAHVRAVPPAAYRGWLARKAQELRRARALVRDHAERRQAAAGVPDAPPRGGR